MSGSGNDGLDPRSDDGTIADLLGAYLDRLNSGERVDRSVIEREHPELAEDLLRELELFSAMGEKALEEAAPRSIGDYRLERRIGQGGMGVVYEAWQASMERRVALKVLPSAVAADGKTVTRFIREARIAGKIHHPNVVSVFGTGVEGGTPYFAMEFVEGETLDRLIARLRAGRGRGASVSPWESGLVDLKYCVAAAEAFTGVAEGLQHAHSLGITHRDLKPSNLILEPGGRLRILDFGLARIEGQESLTVSGAIIGTPLYMSPEQARAKKIAIDHRTDIFSLGSTLYEVLAWRAAFRGGEYQETLSRILHDEPEPPRRAQPLIPSDLETVVLKCLEKSPEDRYRTAEALAQDLARFARGSPVEARPRSRWERWRKRIWQRRRLVVASAAALAVFLALGFLLTEREREALRRKRETYERKVERAVLQTQFAQISLRTIFSSASTENLEILPNTQGLLIEGFSSFLDPFEEARSELEGAVALIPDLPDAHYFRARLSFSQGRKGECLPALDRSMALDPTHLGAKVFRAVLQELEPGLFAGRGASTVEAPRGEVEKDLFSVMLALARRDWDAAFQALEELDRATPKGFSGQRADNAVGRRAFELETRLAHAVASFERANFLGALMDISGVQAGWPEHAELARIKGRILYLLGEKDQAEAVFQRSHAESSRADEVAYELVHFYCGQLLSRVLPMSGRSWTSGSRSSWPI